MSWNRPFLNIVPVSLLAFGPTFDAFGSILAALGSLLVSFWLHVGPCWSNWLHFDALKTDPAPNDVQTKRLYLIAFVSDGSDEISSTQASANSTYIIFRATLDSPPLRSSQIFIYSPGHRPVACQTLHPCCFLIDQSIIFDVLILGTAPRALSSRNPCVDVPQTTYEAPDDRFLLI